MTDILKPLFSPGHFEPHSLHFVQAPGLMWSIIIGNALTALAYILIPLAIIYFVRKRKDLAFHWVFLFFGLFIFSCAVTHIMHIVTFFYPLYPLQATLDIVTGVISLGTAVALVPIIPLALKLPSPSQLKELNRKLAGANRELERMNKEEVNKLAAIVEYSNDAIYRKSTRGIIQSWNKGAENIYGYSSEEVIGKHINIVVPDEKRKELQVIFEKLKKGYSVNHFETIRKRKDGRLVYISLTISPIKDAKGKTIAFSVVARDTTQQKDMERRKEEFISMASHELRTPVASIKAFVQTLCRQLEKGRKINPVPYLTKIEGQLDKLTALIYDLLDMSRTADGKLLLHKEEFALEGLIRETIADIQNGMYRHRIHTNGMVATNVHADRYRIHQVLLNLLTNAIKYSPKADTVIVSVKHDKNTAVVSVQDFGIGISREHRKKIFDRFYRVFGEHDRNFPGLGVGLYIASEIIKRHNGKIWVDSKDGEGSTFYFSIPRK